MSHTNVQYMSYVQIIGCVVGEQSYEGYPNPGTPDLVTNLSFDPDLGRHITVNDFARWHTRPKLVNNEQIGDGHDGDWYEEENQRHQCIIGPPGHAGSAAICRQWPIIRAPDLDVIGPDPLVLPSVEEYRRRYAYGQDPDDDDEHVGSSLDQVSPHGAHDPEEAVARYEGQGQDAGHQREHWKEEWRLLFNQD